LDSFYQAPLPLFRAHHSSHGALLRLTQDQPTLAPSQLLSSSTVPSILSSPTGPSSPSHPVHTPPFSISSPRPVSQPELQQPIHLPSSVVISASPFSSIAPSSSQTHSHSPTLLSSSQMTHSRNIHHMVTRTKDSTRHAKEFRNFIVFHFSIEPDPTSFTQAVKSSNWRDAMANEINALAKNNTWTLVSPPTD
jgi:hypothetical protein